MSDQLHPISASDVGADARGVLWMALRYALGRQTYAVQEVGDAIAHHAHRLEPWQRERMAEEVERELGYAADDAAWGSNAATWRQVIADLRAPQPAVPNGEDMPARLDAAAEALEAQGRGLGLTMRRAAADLRYMRPDDRATVAAALARPTGAGS